MAFSMLMRNSKLRTALYVIVAAGMCLTIYMLRSTHSQLNDIMNQYDTCQQQKDSLLAQMQVVYEQKNRVEKYLQQERQEHKQTKAENQKSIEMRLLTEKDKREVESKNTELQKENQVLEEKKQQVESQLSQLQETQNQKEEEKKQLQSELNSRLQEIQNSKTEEVDKLQGQINTLQLEKGKLQHQSQLQEWELKQLNNKLQFCQSKQVELEKQLSFCSINVTLDSSPKPRLVRLPDAKNYEAHEDEHHPREEKPEKTGDGVVNSVIMNSANNNQPLIAPKMAQLPAMGESGPKQGGGELYGVGGGDSLPAAVPPDKPVTTNVPPLKLPLIEKKMSGQIQRNPDGLLEQIQPPNADIGKKNQGILDSRKEVHELNHLGPPLEDADHKDIGFHIPEHRLLEERRNPVENNLARPFIGNVGPNVPPQQFGGQIKRGPQPDHRNQHFNQFDEDNNYAEEGDDDNAEEQDGGDDHINVVNKRVARDQDFDDQDNGDGMDNNHAKEEGVMLAPK